MTTPVAAKSPAVQYSSGRDPTLDPREVRSLWGLIFLDNSGRGMSLVIQSWLALSVSGQPKSLVWVLIWFNLFSLLLGPSIGNSIRRYGTRMVSLLGSCASAIAAASLFLLAQRALSISLLAICAAAGSLGSLCTMLGLQGAAQELAPRTSATRLASQVATAGALGVALGSYLGGMLLDRWSEYALLSLAGTYLLLSCLLGLRRRPETDGSSRATAESRGASTGVFGIVKRSGVALAGIGIVLSFSALNLLTVMLPLFSKYIIAGSAHDFGLLRAAWSIGAIIGGVALSLLPSSSRSTGAPPAKSVLGSLGVGLIAISLCRSVWSTAVALSIVGLLFASTRSVFEGLLFRVLSHAEYVRTRSYIQSAVGFLALLMSIAPAALSPNLSWLPFAALGAAIVGASSFLGLSQTPSALRSRPL